METPEIALTIALLALLGVFVNALVAANSARKRGELDEKLISLKSRLDQINAVELAKVQTEHSAKLEALEFDRNRQSEIQERRRNADAATLEKILAILSPDRVSGVLKHHDFGGIYDRRDTELVFQFVHLSDRPDCEFFNPELEQFRISLVSSARTFTKLLALKTHPRQGTFSSVLPEGMANQEWPDSVRKNATEINEAATQFVEVFEQLV